MSDEDAAPQPMRQDGRTALDVRADHRVLQSFSDSELEAMPLLGEGEALARRGQYLDLHDPARAGFVAEGDEVVEPGQHVVARNAEVPSSIRIRSPKTAREYAGSPRSAPRIARRSARPERPRSR